MKKIIDKIGIPRLIIASFFILLFVLAGVYGMNIPMLISDVLRRWGMYGVLVLAMIPSIQCGIGPNFGISIGITGGLMGALISVDLRYYGFFDVFANNPTLDAAMGALVAILLALVISSILGVLYGILLNQVKGSEMTVSTYIGFSFIALMNIMWLMLPFRSPTSIWPLGGDGLRNTISLESDFRGIFNKFLEIPLLHSSSATQPEIIEGVAESVAEGGVATSATIPTGLILFFLLTCFVVWIFTKSRAGIMMSAAGSNPNYARAAGINIDKMRILGTTVSTALGGVGIILYAQSFGYLQLYNAPQMMGFSCVAAVLIGGASIKRARISHVLIGTLFFQGILAVALPVANKILPEGNLSEILRVIISNGVILYALSKSKGGTK